MSEQYSEINTDTLERVTEIFKALGDYNRIRIEYVSWNCYQSVKQVLVTFHIN